MTRDEILPFVGKYVCISLKPNNANTYFDGKGFLSIHKSNCYAVIHSFYNNASSSIDEYSYLKNYLENTDYYFPFENIDKITEVEKLFFYEIPVYEYFGHEIGNWLSKPIQKVLIDLSRFPHICRKCNSPSWNNPVTGHSDCSNKNCK